MVEVLSDYANKKRLEVCFDWVKTPTQRQPSQTSILFYPLASFFPLSFFLIATLTDFFTFFALFSPSYDPPRSIVGMREMKGNHEWTQRIFLLRHEDAAATSLRNFYGSSFIFHPASSTFQLRSLLTKFSFINSWAIFSFPHPPPSPSPDCGVLRGVVEFPLCELANSTTDSWCHLQLWTSFPSVFLTFPAACQVFYEWKSQSWSRSGKLNESRNFSWYVLQVRLPVNNAELNWINNPQIARSQMNTWSWALNEDIWWYLKITFQASLPDPKFRLSQDVCLPNANSIGQPAELFTKKPRPMHQKQWTVGRSSR